MLVCMNAHSSNLGSMAHVKWLIHIYIHVRIHVYMYVLNLYICICVFIHVYMNMHTSTYMCVMWFLHSRCYEYTKNAPWIHGSSDMTHSCLWTYTHTRRNIRIHFEYTCTWICLYICKYIYTYMYIFIFIRETWFIHSRSHEHKQPAPWVHTPCDMTHSYLWTYTHIYIYRCVNTCIYTCIYIYIQKAP